MPPSTPPSSIQTPDVNPEGESRRLSIYPLSTLIYSSMALAALLIMWFWNENLKSSFVLPTTPKELGKLAAMAFLAAGVLLITSIFFEDMFAGYRRLRTFVTRALGHISAPGAFYLALLSAVGEELLFRGAIQPVAGLVLASTIFALLHIGPDGRLSTWSLWTFIAGLLLGSMYEHTGNLIVPMVTHFVVNFYSLMRIRRLYRRYFDGVSVALSRSNAASAATERRDEERD